MYSLKYYTIQRINAPSGHTHRDVFTHTHLAEFMNSFSHHSIKFSNRSDKLTDNNLLSDPKYKSRTTNGFRRNERNRKTIVAVVQFCFEINLKPSPLLFWCELMSESENKWTSSMNRKRDGNEKLKLCVCVVVRFPLDLN